MIRALSPEGMSELRRVAALQPMVALDFDGTLAPIVDVPGAARMRAPTASLLRTLSRAYPCVVVSGRARSDVMGRVSSASLVAVVGNHGIEDGAGVRSAAIRARAKAWASALRHALRDHSAYIVVEDKGASVAVHFRGAPAPHLAERRILSLAAALPGARVFGGHAVVNVVPAGAPTKGDALASLAARLGSRAVIYVGDDETDEDAFRAPVVTLPIRIGRSSDSSAHMFLDHQTEIDALLTALIDARSDGSHPDSSPFEGDREP